MKNRLNYIVIILAVFIFSGSFKSDNDIYYQISKSIDVFGRVYKEVALSYVDEVNPEELMYSAIDKMLKSLDPYTVLYDEKRKEDVNFLTYGKYGGIGVAIGLRNDSLVVVDIFDGYSAHRKGIRIGDIIKRINDVEVNASNYEEISNLVKGEPGTTLQMYIKRANTADLLKFNLVREEVQIKNVIYSDFTSDDSNIGYIKLSGFTRTAGDEIKDAIEDLKNKRELNSLILDLRGNPGGLLEAAVDVSEKFLQKDQLIVTVVGRDSNDVKEYYSKEEPVFGSENLIVLIDHETASAAEIVSGAIQDHDRGIIVGTGSYGKGLVQSVVPLSYNTSLKITTAKYFTPSGRLIQKINYAKDNKIFTKNNQFSKIEEFNTDNQRIVFSAGGIKPDSLVINDTNSVAVKYLKTKGVFFDFADHYFYKNENINFNKIDKNLLFNEFISFLETKNISVESNSIKKINELEIALKNEAVDEEILDEINSIKIKLKDLNRILLSKYKENIKSEIVSELAIRYSGSKGRIQNLLQYDNQYLTAIDLLNKKYVYLALLSSNK